MLDLSGRPLLDTAPDQALFAGRLRELSTLLGGLNAGLNVLVVGSRGAGKTSLLRQAILRIRTDQGDEGAPPVLVEGRLATGPREFIDLVRLRMGLAPVVRTPGIGQVALGMTGRLMIEESLELPRLVWSLREGAADEIRRVIFVDELDPEIAQVVFGQLRDEVWQLPFVWVVAVEDNVLGAFLQPPMDVFFDVVLQLEPLDLTSQREVLEARAGAQGAELASQIDEGNTRRLLALARDALLGGADVATTMREAAERSRKAAGLGRPAAMLLAELESLGPSSASDERLLSRMGWTRERAVQVLHQLEEAGLVVAGEVKGEVGRPKKVYRVATSMTAGPSA